MDRGSVERGRKGGGLDVSKLLSVEQVTGQVYNLARDQLGCRFLQKQLEDNTQVCVFVRVCAHASVCACACVHACARDFLPPPPPYRVPLYLMGRSIGSCLSSKLRYSALHTGVARLALQR